MSTALSVYKKILKEFEITDELNVQSINKLLYLREQRDQQRAVINRLLFDLATTRIHQQTAKDPTTSDAYRKKYDDYTSDLRQLTTSLKINLELIDELEAEHPES